MPHSPRDLPGLAFLISSKTVFLYLMKAFTGFFGASFGTPSSSYYDNYCLAAFAGLPDFLLPILLSELYPLAFYHLADFYTEDFLTEVFLTEDFRLLLADLPLLTDFFTEDFLTEVFLTEGFLLEDYLCFVN